MAEVSKQWEGQVINGKFRLQQYLGGCGHSGVFLTERVEKGLQKAAIRLVLADAKNADLQLSRWKTASKLSHPNLIRFFEMGRCQLDNAELLYLVMEYAEENLSQVLPNRALTPEEASDMLDPILNALAYLHSKGFVHGHLKPSNIMAINDQLKLSSDGLCRIGVSNGGMWKQSVYDPPEAAHGKTSPAGDVWSLGMTLVEVLTQRLPVGEGTAHAEPALSETVPAPFLELVRHCLRRDPHRRWTVAQIAERQQQTFPKLQKQTAPRPQKTFTHWRYVVPRVVLGLALAALLAVPSLLHRRPGAQRAPSVASEQPKVETSPKQEPAGLKTEQPTRKASDQKKVSQGPGGVAPATVPLRVAARAKAPTGGRVQGGVLNHVLPDVSPKARNSIRGRVRVTVRVSVDASGEVTEATLDSPGPSKYFSNLALQAARRWKFRPAQLEGQAVPSVWLLRFEFGKAATNVFPAQAPP